MQQRNSSGVQRSTGESKKLSKVDSDIDSSVTALIEPPKWSEKLDTLIPDFLFSCFPLVVKKPAEGLQQIIADCSRNRSVHRKILLNGQPNTMFHDLSEEPSIGLPLIEAVLEGNGDTFLKNKQEDEFKKLQKQIKDVNDIYNKLKKYLGEKGRLLTLTLFDRGELLPYQFMLEKWAKSINHLFLDSNASNKVRSTIEFKYIEEKEKNIYTIESVSNGILVQNVGEKPDENIDKNVMIGTRLIVESSVTPDGKLEVKPSSTPTRELYTSSKNPYFLQQLLAMYLEERVEASFEKENKELKQEDKLSPIECKKFAEEIRKNSALSLLLAKKGNNDKRKIDDLIKKLISTRIEIDFRVSSIQSKIDQLMEKIKKQNGSKQILDGLTISWDSLCQESLLTYFGVLTLYPDDQFFNFNSIFEKRLEKLDWNLSKFLQRALIAYIENEASFAEKRWFWQQKLPSEEYKKFAQEFKADPESTPRLTKKSNEKSKMDDIIEKLICTCIQIKPKISEIQSILDTLAKLVDLRDKNSENTKRWEGLYYKSCEMLSYRTLLTLYPDDPSGDFDLIVRRQLESLGDKTIELEAELTNPSLRKIARPS